MATSNAFLEKKDEGLHERCNWKMTFQLINKSGMLMTYCSYVTPYHFFPLFLFWESLTNICLKVLQV